MSCTYNFVFRTEKYIGKERKIIIRPIGITKQIRPSKSSRARSLVYRRTGFRWQRGAVAATFSPDRKVAELGIASSGVRGFGGKEARRPLLFSPIESGQAPARFCRRTGLRWKRGAAAATFSPD